MKSRCRIKKTGTRKIKLCELLYLSRYKKKTNKNKWEHYETEQIKTCMFLTVRDRVNKAELFLEPGKKINK